MNKKKYYDKSNNILYEYIVTDMYIGILSIPRHIPRTDKMNLDIC